MKSRKCSVFQENLIFSVIIFGITGIVLHYNLRLSDGANLSFRDMDSAVSGLAVSDSAVSGLAVSDMASSGLTSSDAAIPAMADMTTVDFSDADTERSAISVFAEIAILQMLPQDSACDTERSLTESADGTSAVLSESSYRYTRVYPIAEPMVKEP